MSRGGGGGGGSVQIDFDSEDGGGSATSELQEYLIQQKSQNNNGVSGFFSNVGTGLKTILPRRVGGTGSIEDDIAVRFGKLFGSSSSLNDGSGVNQASTSATSGWGPNLVRLSLNKYLISCLMLNGPN